MAENPLFVLHRVGFTTIRSCCCNYFGRTGHGGKEESHFRGGVEFNGAKGLGPECSPSSHPECLSAQHGVKIGSKKAWRIRLS
jgi:hypothetical protein